MPRNAGRTKLGNALWTPYSMAVLGGGLAWMGGLWASALPFTLFQPFEKFQMKWVQPNVATPLKFALSKLEVDYDPAFDKTKMSVFMQNHVSMLDAGIACGSIPVPLCGLENAAHLQLPGYGWLLRMSNAIPVRKGGRRYEEIAAAFEERASRGISVLTFPEAHRTLDGNVGSFKRGVFKIAVKSNLPIAPLCVRGAYNLLPKGEFTIRPTRIEVYMAPQIDTTDLTDDDVPELMERVHEVMRSWVEDGVKRPELCTAPFGAQRDAADS
ncbi:MAG: 1-acyl-sn-glycerol-3-phosphate acyltransferase [Nannocystaceae bacterium]|nr:1-acyl-sn-glycerol-3-phosphate acyltransferase [Nannocystaceae bacterium]